MVWKGEKLNSIQILNIKWHNSPHPGFDSTLFDPTVLLKTEWFLPLLFDTHSNNLKVIIDFCPLVWHKLKFGLKYSKQVFSLSRKITCYFLGNKCVSEEHGKSFPWLENLKKNANKLFMGFSAFVYYEAGRSCESSQDNVFVISVSSLSLLISDLHGAKSPDTNSAPSFKLHCNSKCHPR